MAGGSIRVDPNVISTVGLALHELATNAIKHGTLANEAGHVTMDWTRAEAGDLVIDWVEVGGPDRTDDPPDVRSTGNGMNIVETLLATIDGTIDRTWTRHGVKARTTMPTMGDEG